MIIYGGGIVTRDEAIQTMKCSSCGKYLGNKGWKGKKCSMM